MEYAKDEVFGIRYQGDITYQTKKKNKFLELMKRHYLISVLVLLGSVFCIMDMIFIYYFINLLGKI